MKLSKEIISAFSTFIFLLSCNFCTVECAVASEGHSHSIPVSGPEKHCHETQEKNGNTDSDHDHDANGNCCSTLVTITVPSAVGTSVTFTKTLIGDAPNFQRLLSQDGNYSVRKFEFPPGASPPQVFLLAHFTHAPPISL